MKTVRSLAPLVFVVACLVAAAPALAAEPAEKTEKTEKEEKETLGQQVDRAVEQLRQESREWGQQIREGVEQMRARVERMGVAARVYARLRWDKALVDAAVSVDVEKDGVATLSGTVPSEPAKAKAETLANDTVGVERVVNHLEVKPPQAKKQEAQKP